MSKRRRFYNSYNGDKYDNFNYDESILDESQYVPRKESEYGTLPIASYLDDINMEDDVQERARRHYRRRG